MQGLKVKVAVASADALGESAFWHPRRKRLFWLNAPPPEPVIRTLDPETGAVEAFPMPQMVTGMRPWNAGGDAGGDAEGESLVVAAHGGVYRMDLESGELGNRVARPDEGQPFNRCNDAGTDAKGRFWFGTMQNNLAPDGSPIPFTLREGALYRLDHDLSLRKVIGRIGIANTLCWSPDNGTFYFADSDKGVIRAYDFDLEAGELSNPRVFAEHERGVPDGSAMDSEGFLWNARWDGNCVIRFDPKGRVDRIVELPVSQVTSCAFGGENLDRLFITSARCHLSQERLREEPEAGHLFVCEPGVTGLPVHSFAGRGDGRSDGRNGA